VRVIRACRELGIRTVAVYSDADRHALHVRMADEAFCIGPPAAAESYLNIPNIMSTAELLGVDAIHPGYGFLAENPHFSEICQDVNITFVGPPPEAIAIMGNKAAARQRMKAAGVPVVPGSEGPVRNESEATDVARSVGFPIIVKASAGGGGRGMRVVHTREDLRRALQTAQAEAEAAFGSGELYLEKYVEEPRHIEVQILADKHNDVCRSWRISTTTSSTWAPATVRFNAAIKSCWRSLRPRGCGIASSAPWARRPSARRTLSTTPVPVRSSSWWIATVIFTSWR